MNSAAELTPRQRLRATYAKGEEVKFISHQDEFRLWERTLRRAGLPLYYKQGFNPQPGLQFAAPLGVGFTGTQEFVDLILSPPQPVDQVANRLRRSLPPGVVLVALEEVALKADALAISLIGADYTIVVSATCEELSSQEVERRMLAFLTADEHWRERERKGERYTYNLRPLVFALRYEEYDVALEEHRLFLRVQQRTGATGRPDEVIAALGLDEFARSLCRTRLYFSTVEEDAALFAHYPVITQDQVSGVRLGKSPQRDAPPPEAARGGRTIGQRAADEFV